MYENKRDAIKAIQRCANEPFLIGQTCKPAKVDWAKLEVRPHHFFNCLKIWMCIVDACRCFS